MIPHPRPLSHCGERGEFLVYDYGGSPSLAKRARGLGGEG